MRWPQGPTNVPSASSLSWEKNNCTIHQNLPVFPIDVKDGCILDLLRPDDLKGLSEMVVSCGIEFRPGLFDQNAFSINGGKIDFLDLLEEVRASLTRTRFNVGDLSEFSVRVGALEDVADVIDLQFRKVLFHGSETYRFNAHVSADNQGKGCKLVWAS